MSIKQQDKEYKVSHFFTELALLQKINTQDKASNIVKKTISYKIEITLLQEYLYYQDGASSFCTKKSTLFGLNQLYFEKVKFFLVGASSFLGRSALFNGSQLCCKNVNFFNRASSIAKKSVILGWSQLDCEKSAK